MNKIYFIFLSFILFSCATYKVSPVAKIESIENEESLEVVQINEWATGKHCFEPMFYVLTLGLMPAHCVDTYSLEENGKRLTEVKVTKMQGWAALIITLFPNWKYGYGEDVDEDIKEKVLANE